MPELAAADVAAFTNNRLPDDEGEGSTTDLLNAALAAARRYCGWHVSPVLEETVEVDGGGRVLSLPTLKLVAVTAITEDGQAVSLSDVDVSKKRGTIAKHPYGYWTCRSGGITVTITHGYTEAEAADWRRAVLRLVDAMSYETVTTREDPALVRKKIDDVEYQWAEGLISSDERLQMMFSQFRILPSP